MRRVLYLVIGIALAGGLLALFLSTNNREDPEDVAASSTEPRLAEPTPETESSTRARAASPAPSLPPTRSAAKPLAKIDKQASAAAGEKAIAGAWGGKLGEFGRKRDDEANPESPMAIHATKGELLVVDQANHRVQRFKDGKPVGTIPISETVQDIAVGLDGKTVMLDRLADKNVQVFDAEGRLVNEAPLEGKGIEQGGRVTGVFADHEGIWAEKDHSTLVRVADPDGNADTERPELPGRPTRDGRVIATAAITDARAGRVVVTTFDRASLEVRWSRELQLSMQILHIVMLDSDLDGYVYLAADIGREATVEPYQILDEVIQVVKLGPDGSVVGSIEIPVSSTGDEMLKPMTVGDDGTIYAMQPGEGGLDVMSYRIR